MTRNIGSLYQRGNVWWIKYYRNGKPYRESTRPTKERYAKKPLKLREGEITLGKIPSLKVERIRFDELAEDFITDYKVTDHLFPIVSTQVNPQTYKP